MTTTTKPNDMEHKITIRSNHDARAECSCGWTYVRTGHASDEEIHQMHDQTASTLLQLEPGNTDDIGIKILDTDTEFTDSPDTGPDCLCSRCGNPILEGEMPLRCFSEDGKTEHRFHFPCVGLPSNRNDEYLDMPNPY